MISDNTEWWIVDWKGWKEGNLHIATFAKYAVGMRNIHSATGGRKLTAGHKPCDLSAVQTDLYSVK
jgi:hypothetical protein